MHTLHRILADIEDLGINSSDFPKEPKEEILSGVRNTILYWLDDIPRPYAFDWHTEDAGRWKDEYPNNVILGSYDVQTLVSELKNIKECQNTDMVNAINIASKYGITTLTDLWTYLQNPQQPKNAMDKDKVDCSMALNTINNYFGNVYNFDSRFLYLNENITIVDTQIIDMVTQSPEQYAMVMIDCHI